MDGKLYGMPWYAGVRSVDLPHRRLREGRRRSRRPPGTSWSRSASTLKAKNPKMITFPVAGDSEYGVYPFIWGNQGEIAEEDGSSWKSDIDSPRPSRASTSTPAWPPSTASPARPRPRGTRPTCPTRFTRGDVAMMIAGSWTPGALVEAEPRPQGQDRRLPDPGPRRRRRARRSWAARTSSVFETAKNKDLAWAARQADDAPASSPQEWGAAVRLLPRHQRRCSTRCRRPNDPVVAPFATQMVEGGASLPVTPLYGAGPGQEDRLRHAPVDPVR